MRHTHFFFNHSVLFAALLHVAFKQVASAAAASSVLSSSNVANLAGIVGSLVEDVKNVQSGLGETYEPYAVGNEAAAADTSGANKGLISGAISGIVLGAGDISNTLTSIAACDPDDKGLCCLMPNYCVTNADCYAEKLTTNVLDLLKAVPTCKCKQGFAGDGRTQGTGCVNIDECATGEALCEDICEDRSPGYSCGCSAGYVLNANGYSCDDIDECQLGTSGCEQECENLPGSFACHCYSGYTLNEDGLSCSDIDECQLMIEIVAANGDSSVLSPLALAAAPDLAICQYTELCINFPGAYGCNCPAGFSIDPNSPTSCVDVDECSAGVTDPTTGELLLSPADSPSGSLCLSSGEMQSRESPSQQCLNLPGSFICQCASGYRVVADSSYNAEFAAHLLETGLARDPLKLHVEDTEAQRELYARAAVNALILECEDIDECLEIDGICGGAVCSNTPGGYSCDCASGYEFSSETGGCVDIDECAVILKTEADDIAALEAAGVVVPCDTAAGEECVNLDGSYACRCAAGYSQVSGPEDGLSRKGQDKLKCQDIDECAEKSLNNCVYECSNRRPGFSCLCPTGYESGGDSSQQCVDIDECSLEFCAPGAACLNLPGSYLCSCPRNQAPGRKTTAAEVTATLSTDMRRWLLQAGQMGATIEAARTAEDFATALAAWNSAVAAGEEELAQLQASLSSAAQCSNVGFCQLLEKEIHNFCPGDATCVDYDSGVYCGCPEGFQLSNDVAAAAAAASGSSSEQIPTNSPSSPTSPATIAGSILGGLFGSTTGLFGRRRLLEKQAAAKNGLNSSDSNSSDLDSSDATNLLTPDEVSLATELGLIRVTDDGKAQLTVSPWVIRSVDYGNFKLSGGLYEDAICRDIDECSQGIRSNGDLAAVCPAATPCCANTAGSWTCSAKRTALLLASSACPSNTVDLSGAA